MWVVADTTTFYNFLLTNLTKNPLLTAMNIINLTVKQLRKAATLKTRIQSLENQLGRILGASTNKPAARVTITKRRKMSRAGRARIIAGQKARWAKAKGGKSAAKPVKMARRKMSAEGRAAISAAAQKRWRVAKAQGRNSL